MLPNVRDPAERDSGAGVISHSVVFVERASPASVVGAVRREVEPKPSPFAGAFPAAASASFSTAI
jgi:hypothetical protein